MNVASPPLPRLRSDAERNRHRILTAAREALAEVGVEVGVDEVARRAGVGVATLYRRFPTKEHLIAAVLEERLRQYVEFGAAAESEPDPWQAFAGYVRAVARTMASDRSFEEALPAGCMPGDRVLSALRDQAHGQTERIIRRARRAGVLRADFGIGDLALFLAGIARVGALVGDLDRTWWERQVALLLAGASATAPGVLPGRSPSMAGIRRRHEERLSR